MDRNKLIAILKMFATMLVVVSSLVGCQSAATPSPTAAPATAAPAAATPAPAPATAAPAPATAAPVATQTLKIGASMALTGVYAQAFGQVKTMFDVQVDDLNAKGGLNVAGKNYKLELVYYDDKFNSDGALATANTLINRDKLKIILGYAGGTLLAVQPIAEENKVFTFSWSTAESALGPKHPLTLSGPSTSARNVFPVWDYVAKTLPEVKKVGALVMETPDITDKLAVYKGQLEERRMSLAFAETYPADIKDFAPLLLRAQQREFDAFFIDNTPGGALYATLAKALQAAGNKKPVIGATGAVVQIAAAGSAAEGLITAGAPTLEDPLFPASLKPLANRMIAKVGDAFSLQNLSVSGVIPALAQAMEKAGTVDDTTKIAQTLAAGEWETPYGKAGFGGTKSFGARVFMDGPHYVIKWVNGKSQIISYSTVRIP